MKNRSENDNMNIENLSITELKQLLSRINHDLKMNKPTIKRAKKIEIIEPSEYDIANSIAKRFTKTVIIENIENKKIKQDIQIQKDILDYLNAGNVIITAKRRKVSKPFTVALSNQVSL